MKSVFLRSSKNLLPLIGFLFLISCQQRPAGDAPVSVDMDSIISDTGTEAFLLPDNRYLLMATLYHQQAAEYEALCYQAYNLATLRLVDDLKDQSINKRRAVVVDVDETVLDNSPYQAACILQNYNYPEGWDEWCNKAIARSVPGALDFLKLAEGYGVAVFYVTNRKAHLRAATVKNLRELGFPLSEENRLMMREEGADKESRRDIIRERYHISLFIGDNLGDFASGFNESDPDNRKAKTAEARASFGKQWIILPNPMYGDWESVFFRGKRALDKESKLLIMEDMLVPPERL